MKPVIQEESTGCAIACAAAIAGLTYREARRIANDLGIVAQDAALWSETSYIRRLLGALGVGTGTAEIPFEQWGKLPDCALLSIKWHEISGRPFWHWVVFARDGNESYVLDSNQALKNNIRTDFGRMHPKWYIEVDNPRVFHRNTARIR